MPLQPLKSSVHEAMHNYIPHFGCSGQHWRQTYDELPTSSVVDNSARTGVVERVRGTLCTRMLMHKVMYMPVFLVKTWLHYSFVSNCSIFSFQLSPCVHAFVLCRCLLSMSPHVSVCMLSCVATTPPSNWNTPWVVIHACMSVQVLRHYFICYTCMINVHLKIEHCTDPFFLRFLVYKFILNYNCSDSACTCIQKNAVQHLSRRCQITWYFKALKVHVVMQSQKKPYGYSLQNGFQWISVF